MAKTTSSEYEEWIFQWGQNPRSFQVQAIRSSRKERGPDREECQYVNCAIAETRWPRTSLMGENNKEKRENTKKWRGGVKVEGGGEGSNITNTSPRLRLIPMGFFSPVAPRVRNFSLLYKANSTSIGVFWIILLHNTLFYSFIQYYYRIYRIYHLNPNTILVSQVVSQLHHRYRLIAVLLSQTSDLRPQSCHIHVHISTYLL